jgi:hypothetical protein
MNDAMSAIGWTCYADKQISERPLRGSLVYLIYLNEACA